MTYALATPITGPEAWLGRETAASTGWIRPISAAGIDEIDAALRGLQKKGVDAFGRLFLYGGGALVLLAGATYLARRKP